MYVCMYIKIYKLLHQCLCSCDFWKMLRKFQDHTKTLICSTANFMPNPNKK